MMEQVNQTLQLSKAQQDIVRLEVEVAHMARSIEALTETMAEQGKSLAEIHRILSEARGGWKTLMIAGGIASALGGGVAWLVSHVRFTP